LLKRWLTKQFADKPTRGQSSRGQVNSRTSQLADSKLFLNHEKTTLYNSPNNSLDEARQYDCPGP